jgi:membrane protease YdiL (CAAX protease family)
MEPGPHPYPAPPGYGAWNAQPVPGQAPGDPFHPQGVPGYPPGVPGYPPGVPGYPPGWPTAAPAKPSALPVEEREYHEFFRAPRFRWWKPVLSLLMFAALWFGAAVVFPGIALAVDLATGRLQLSDLNGPAEEVVKKVMTPLGFTANNIALALSIPAAGLTAWALHGQRPRWMSSIAGGFRWGLLGRFVLVAGPIFLLSFGLEIVLGGPPEFRWNADSTFLILAILVTTPFQAAGEEYALRGLVARAVGSWFGWRRLGLVVAAVLSSVLFMVLHNANNPWLNTYYFTVGMICSVLAWRTGGLEAPVALHVCNNLVSEITLPFGGLQSMFDRGPDSAGPLVLLQLAFTFSVMAGMLWLAHRLGLSRTAAPGRPQPPPVQEVFWNSSHTIA